jgi:hypothetical protein
VQKSASQFLYRRGDSGCRKGENDRAIVNLIVVLYDEVVS